MNPEPDYELLYHMAQLQIENLNRQVEHWEMKAKLLRQMADQLATFANEIEMKVELLKSGAIDIKKTLL